MHIIGVVVFLFSFSTSLVPILNKTFYYGKSTENFGIRIEKEPIGPYSFAVKSEDGSIYIPDPVNGNIKVVSTSGVIEQVIPFRGYYDDIRVDGNGNIYILDRSGERVLYINSDGKSIKEYEVPYDLLKDPCKLKIKGDNIFISNMVDKKIVNLKSKQFSEDTYEADIKDGYIDIFFHKNGTIKQIASQKIEGIVSAEFLGTDYKGNIFIQVETKKPDIGVDLRVLKFNSEGTLIGNYKIPHNDYFVWTARLLDIDYKGNIYQVLPAKDRLEVNIWKTE